MPSRKPITQTAERPISPRTKIIGQKVKKVTKKPPKTQQNVKEKTKRIFYPQLIEKEISKQSHQQPKVVDPITQ